MRRGLGKGLSQLLSDAGDETGTGLATLPITAIRANSRQPRSVFEQEPLEELAASIREFGVLQPLIVRPVGEDQYELIAGERRLRASKLAGLREVPVVIRTSSAQESLEIALIENVQREDISAVECAVAYRRLIDEFGLNADQVAEKVGKKRSTISNTLRLLKLPKEMQQAIQEGAITEGHARAILMADTPVRQQQVFSRALQGISVREAERLARAESHPRVPGPEPKKPKAEAGDPNWAHLEAALSEYFGAPVRLNRGEIGGRLTLDFYSDEDLQRVLDILGFTL